MFMDVNTRCKPLVTLKNLKAKLKFVRNIVKEGDPLDNETKKDGKKNVWRRKRTAVDVKHTTSYSGDNVTGRASNAASGISLQ